MSHFIVIHRVSTEFWFYNQLGLFTIYENQRIHLNSSQFIAVRRNSSQFVATDPSESKNFVFCDEIEGIPMN